MDQNQIDPKKFNQVSQLSHFGNAAMVILACHLFFDLFITSLWTIFLIIVVLWKEYWYDPRYENVATRGSSNEDVFFHLVGFGFSWSLIFLSYSIHYYINN